MYIIPIVIPLLPAQETIRFQMSESENKGVTLLLPSFKHTRCHNMNQCSLTVNQEQVSEEISKSRIQSQKRCLILFFLNSHFPIQKIFKHTLVMLNTMCS